MLLIPLLAIERYSGFGLPSGATGIGIVFLVTTTSAPAGSVRASMLTPATAAATEYKPIWRLRIFEMIFFSRFLARVDMEVLRNKFENAFRPGGGGTASRSFERAP